MLVLIPILILIAITVFIALLESFFTPEDLSQMGIHLGYSRSNGSSTSRSENLAATQEIPTQPRPQMG